MITVVRLLLVAVLLCSPVYAETAAPEQQQGDTSVRPGQQGPMKCPKMEMEKQEMMMGAHQMQCMSQMSPMMGGMMGHGMMARDLMQMMADVVKMQQKMIRGLSPVEKREMQKETDRMLDRIEKMMSEMRWMMLRGATGQPPSPAAAPTESPTEEQGDRRPSAPHH